MHSDHNDGIHADESYGMRADCNKNHSKSTSTIFAPSLYEHTHCIVARLHRK